MATNHNDGLLYIDNANKNIYFYDTDVPLLKKLGKILVEDYPKYQVLAFDNLPDFKDDLIKERPTLLIMEITEESAEEVLEIVRKIRGDVVDKSVPIVFTGIRENLEKYSREIQNFDIHVIPKAIRVPLFKSVIQTAITEANTMQVDIITLQEGEHLFLDGDTAESIYIIKKGQLEVYKNHDGEDFVLGKIKDGEVVGEMAFLEGNRRSASVRALEECEILNIHLANLREYLGSQPFWLEMILHALVERLYEANKKIVGKK